MTSSPPSLPQVLSGERREIDDARAGRISYYIDGPVAAVPGTAPPPLLLVHSVNATASAHEVRPLFDAFKQRRRTCAIDLPGYGHSERSERPYRQRLMVDALHAVLADLREENGGCAVDTLAVSLSCEFLAKAALEAPDSVRSVALVSPTGFSRRTATRGPPDADRGSDIAYRILSAPVLGRVLFRLLTTRPVIRFFLRKTWGRKDIDEEMNRQAWRMSRAPGARWAPFHFLSGFLFSADIPTVYRALEQPVWVAHGIRGDFTDYSGTKEVEDRPNWRIDEFRTGALPYFEVPEAFIERYDRFLDRVEADRAVHPGLAD